MHSRISKRGCVCPSIYPSRLCKRYISRHFLAAAMSYGITWNNLSDLFRGSFDPFQNLSFRSSVPLHITRLQREIQYTQCHSQNASLPDRARSRLPCTNWITNWLSICIWRNFPLRTLIAHVDSKAAVTMKSWWHGPVAKSNVKNSHKETPQLLNRSSAFRKK